MVEKSSRGTHMNLYATPKTLTARVKRQARRMSLIGSKVLKAEVLKVQLTVLDSEEVKPCGNF